MCHPHAIKSALLRRLVLMAVIFLLCSTFLVFFSVGGRAASGDIIPVSTTVNGTYGNYGSGNPVMTPDGRYIAFSSVATNLVPVPPPDGVQAVYWKDLSTGAVKLVCADAAGVPAQYDSFLGAISHDGRYVTIFSYEPALVNPPVSTGDCWVFRKDMTTGAVLLVSSNSAGEAGDGYNMFPSISADGSMVAFMSDADNLTTPAPTTANSIYLKNLTTGKTTLLSASKAGVPGDEVSTFPAISADGRYVSFLSASSNFITPKPPDGINQVYRKDTETGDIALVSSDVSGKAGNDNSSPPALDPEGRFVAFPSEAGNLVATKVPSGVRELFLKDMETGIVKLASSSKPGTPGNGNCDEPAVSLDGRYVSFESVSDNLLSPAPSGDFYQVYRKDTHTGDILMVSTSAAGDYGNNASAQSSITPDGKYVAFGSSSDNLTTPAPPAEEVYRKRMPAVPTTWYLAEGTNAWGFSTYISLENPNDNAVSAKLTYMNPNPSASGNGVVGTRTITLPPLSQTCVSSVTDIGNIDFSTRVDCPGGEIIAVDRTMFWTGEGLPPDRSGYHNSIGATAPSKTWYLPEGSSAWGFETWTLVLNPNNDAAAVELTYMTESGPVTRHKTVPANSRATYNMASDVDVTDASIRVTSDLPVIAERSMYRNNRREGSCSIGATTPSEDYFLAEGATGYDVGFKTYVLIQNPNNTANDITITYQTGNGPVDGPAFTMQPGSRKTVLVNDRIPANTNVSTLVHGSKPLVAERAMYWDNGTGQAFHASIGLDSPHMSFYMPDGQISNGFETWTLVQNPNPGAVTVRITYLPQNGGTPVSFTDEIPPGTRYTYNMADKLKVDRASIMVESLDGARPVLGERAMYTNDKGSGTDTIGGHSND